MRLQTRCKTRQRFFNGLQNIAGVFFYPHNGDNMNQWRIHKNQFVTVYTSGMDIVMDDAITGQQIQRKTVHERLRPYVKKLFFILAELGTDIDTISKHAQVNNTRFIILNHHLSPSFIFPKFVKELIECCYIVASMWGWTLQELGYTSQGYQVRFVGVVA